MHRPRPLAYTEPGSIQREAIPGVAENFDNQGTDFHALKDSLDADIVAEAQREASREPVAQVNPSDYAQMRSTIKTDHRPVQHRTATDYLVDVTIPIAIFLLVYAVLYFLLDVREIFYAARGDEFDGKYWSEEYNSLFRFVCFCVVMGVVALNRVIARDGSDESILYIFGLAGAVGLFTFMFSVPMGVGSIARGFLDGPFTAVLFNMAIMGVIWWTTNRLMHECCIDENETAGDVGILTGTLMRMRQSIQREDPKAKVVRTKEKKRKQSGPFEMMEIEAIDPTAWREPKPEESAFHVEKADQRLSRRHPGISVFYFSVPAFLIFALGQRAMVSGGDGWVAAGHVYVGIFTCCALVILLMTSLGGIREYFRRRRIQVPAGIGWFWLGLGGAQVLFVLFGALLLLTPGPADPPGVYVGDEAARVKAEASKRLGTSIAAQVGGAVDDMEAIRTIAIYVVVGLALFGLFAFLRAFGVVAAAIARNRDHYPLWVVRFFDWLDKFLEKILRVPTISLGPKRVRISPDIATCSAYHSPLEGAGVDVNPENIPNYIAVSYEALCALAYDLGVPRRKDQTPYEFIQSFPKPLYPLREEALEITEMYVRSAYGDYKFDGRIIERLRKFWWNYNRVRKSVVR